MDIKIKLCQTEIQDAIVMYLESREEFSRLGINEYANFNFHTNPNNSYVEILATYGEIEDGWISASKNTKNLPEYMK